MADVLATSGARLTMILGATVVFLGLAVLGWGGFPAFFSHPALTALVLASFAISAAAFFAGGNLSTGEREDRSNRWVIAAFTVIGLLFAWLPAWTDRNGVWTIDADAVRWLGVALYTLGGALRIYPVYVLGNRFSGLVAIQPGHALVTTGIYRVIRHPSYLGLLVNALGWALAFRSGAGVLLAALLIPVLLSRISSEEALLRERFGAETTPTGPGRRGSFQECFERARRGRACPGHPRSLAQHRHRLPRRCALRNSMPPGQAGRRRLRCKSATFRSGPGTG